ncbi:MAG TPA: hyalin, partial [Saprospirales bacterium]|nr:hyalin [Saprospirales bacterium]
SSLSRVGIAGAIVTTIATFPGSGFPSQLTVAGTNLFFEAGTDVMGRELWRSNSAGTVLVQDLVAGAINANISNLCARNSEVLFASDGLGGNELRKSNGAINGVITILNIGRASSSPKEF